MSATKRFKRWIASLGSNKKSEAPEEAPREPSEDTRRIVRRYKKQEAEADDAKPLVSVYALGDNIVHIVFNNNVARVVRQRAEEKKNVDYVKVKDSITRTIKRVKKKDIGGLSRVVYYDEKGRLID